MSKLFKLTLIFFFLLLFYKSQVFAAGECINPNPPPGFYDSTHACNNWVEYDCPWGTDYGYNVGKRTVTQYCNGISADCTGTISYGNWFSFDDCDDCQYCNPATVASNPVCTLVPPPLSPSDGATSVKTPVTLDWCNVVGAGSYQLEVYEVDSGGTETNFRTEYPISSDFCVRNFSEDTEYKWQVADCSNSDGTGCGTLGQKWGLTTDGAETVNTPSPSSPGDGASVSIPVTLDWPSVLSAKSYYVNIYDSSDQLLGVDIVTASQATFGLCPLSKNTTYKWEVAACLNDNGTRCGSNCCDNESGNECADLSAIRTFTTTDTATLDTPTLLSPASTNGVPVVGLSDSLNWERVCGANSYRYEIKQNGTTIINNATSSRTVGFNLLWSNLEFGTIYSWHVKSCWDSDGNQCEANWSGDWQFKTTGGTPAGLYPADGATGIVIPVELSWDNVVGTFSYQYQVATDSGFTNIIFESSPKSSFGFVDYPDVTISTTYWWRIRSCIDTQGTVCGEWSSARSLTTGGLNTPSNPSPSDNGALFTYERTISWDPDPSSNPGARHYRYRIDYASLDGESDPACIPGQEVIPFTVVSSNSAYISINCLGVYNWWVQACLDENCTVTSPLSPEWHFTHIQPQPPAQFGLLPCNRISDNPNTSWNERDSCGLSHIILIFKGIIDLILWRIGLIVLVLLIVATAVIFFFSLGAPATVVNVKSIWKRAGQGYAIMFLAWIIINMLVKIVGFTDKWWELPF